MKEITEVPRLPERRADAHKGDFGRVLVVAGSCGMAGAASLCAEAVLRSGAGLVYLAVPEEVYPIVASHTRCVIHHVLPQTKEGTFSKKAAPIIQRLAAENDVVVLGPGVSRNEETAAMIVELTAVIEQAAVIDADGLNAIAGSPACLKGAAGPRILTPHPGEMARLASSSTERVQARRADTAADFASEYGCLVVLKGNETIVSGGDLVYTNRTGNPGMATAGSGDVLTGIIAGLLAQGLGAFQAAQLGVYLHGRAGDTAGDAMTQYCVTASDILDFLPDAFRTHAAAGGSDG